MSAVEHLGLSDELRALVLDEVRSNYETALVELEAATAAHREAARVERELRQKVMQLHLTGHTLAGGDTCPFDTHVEMVASTGKESTADRLMTHLLDIYPETLDAASAVEHLESLGWTSESADRKNNVRAILNRLVRQGRINRVGKGEFMAIASTAAAGAVAHGEDSCDGDT